MINDLIEPTTTLRIDTVDYQQLYKRLCRTDSSRRGVFPTMWELFVWGAILGYIYKIRKPINKLPKSLPFRWQVIKDHHKKMLVIFAIESTDNFDIINNPTDLKLNIEEHANGGLYLVHQEMTIDKISYLETESLISSIQKRYHSDPYSKIIKPSIEKIK